MTARKIPRWIAKYAAALLATFVALGVRIALDPWLGDRAPVLTLFPTVALLAWYAGAGPALLSTAVGVLGADWYFISPRESLELSAMPDMRLYSSYLLACGVVVFLAALGRRRHRLAEELAQQRHHAVEALEKTRARMQGLLDTVPTVIYQIDADGRYVFVNRRYEALVAHPLDDIVGRHVTDIFPPEVAAPFIEHNREVLASGCTMSFEERQPADDGERVYASIKTPIFGDDGHLDGILGISTDITAQKHTEQQLRDNEARLREADRRKDEFLAMLSHELRNPLAPILTAVQLLKLESASPEDHERTLHIVERQAKLMARLVDDLLDISRLSRGRIELRNERVDLAVPIADAAQTCRPLLDGAGHHFELKLPEQPVHVDGDVVRLAQIVANLLNNAAKYTAPGGHITVELVTDGGEALIRVADDGIGIAPPMREHIFEMFVQADHHSAGSQGGLGIGLTLAAQLAQMHGGSIEAHSDGTNQGSTFTVRLPVATSATANTGPAPAPPSAPPRALRIVVADDNLDAAESLRLLLEALGHEVSATHDGVEAVQAAAAFEPDVALLDIGMPRLDGYEAARRIRALERGDDIRLVALTGWGQEEDLRKSVAAGFDHHITKPVDRARLDQLLAEVEPRVTRR